MNRYLLAVAAFASVTAGAGHHEEKVNATPEWQRSVQLCCADFIGDFATIIGSDGTVLREGNNGWTCQSGNPRTAPKMGWNSAHQAMPVCHDDEGMKWMMAFMQGKKPDMERDSYMWMLHGDVGEDNTTPAVMNKSDSKPGHWIESGPHLMLMPKDPTSLENFSTDFTTGAPYVMFAGTDFAHLMIPMPGYYQYQPESSPK